MNIIKKLKTKFGEEKGMAIFVVYIVFFPIFLISLTLLFEMTKIQSLKNINECITDISANAASRQFNYGVTTNSILLRTKYDGEDTDRTVWQVNDTANYSEYLDNYSRIKSVTNGYGYNLDTYDNLSANSIATALYALNASQNNLNTESLKVKDFNVNVSNIAKTYKDPTLNKNFTTNFPSVFVKSTITYRINPMMVMSLLPNQQTLNISSSSIAQIVPTDSSTR